MDMAATASVSILFWGCAVARVEESIYSFFEGNQWWVYEIFVLKGESYAYLMREDPFRVSYGKLEDGQLIPVTNEMKQKLAVRYQQILIVRINNVGEDAIPRVGKVLKPHV
jgi:hypothetical protein